MNKLKTTIVLTLLLASALMVTSTYTVSASETLVWGADVYSDGTPVTSPVLESGKLYRIVAAEIFWYDYANNLAADAMYYTTDPSNHWQWVNHLPAPGGHSFLQINGADVYWGPFSNGDTGHTYFITYIGQGSPITFRIIDWIDRSYENNHCHLPVEIYLVEGNGLTPGYWKNHLSAWPAGYSPTDDLQTVFGPDAPDVDLLKALQGGGGKGLDGAKKILARAATAALLNAEKFGADYPMVPAAIISIVTNQFSHGTRESMLYWATILDNYNNLGT